MEQDAIKALEKNIDKIKARGGLEGATAFAICCSFNGPDGVGFFYGDESDQIDIAVSYIKAIAKENGCSEEEFMKMVYQKVKRSKQNER